MTDVLHDPAQRLYCLHKSRQVAEAVASNLRTTVSLPYAFNGAAQLPAGRSGRFVVVGAGPSLEKNGHELKRLQADGALICTVNTALKKVAQYVTPDVVLAREIVDISDHLAYDAGMYVLDVGVHPNALLACKGKQIAWFLPAQTAYYELAHLLGVRPLYGGGAALTALVALCEQWGAKQIVLMGVDLAIAEDGTGYAPGTAFGDYHVSGTTGYVTGNGQAEKQRAHAKSFVPPPVTTMGLREVDGWVLGTKVQAMQVYWDQLEWLGNFAHRHGDVIGDGISVVDATEGGASKDGWLKMRASTLQKWSSQPFTVPGTVHNGAKALADIQRQCATAVDLCANVMHENGFPMGLPELMRGSDLVDLAASRDLLRSFESGLDVQQKIAYAYSDAWPDAARAIKKASGT